MFAAAATFFSEPLEVKRRLAIGNSPAHRGYVGIGAESLDDTGRGDAKESLDTGGEQGPDHPEVVAGTRANRRRHLGTARRGDDVPPQVHPLPSQRAQPLAPGQLGSGVHTDYGSVTLLDDDGVGGLQVVTREGTWLEVGVPEDALVVNLGDPAVQRRHLLHRNLPRPG
jgi:isopenicillin N synthase-like dioxygenase